MKSPNRGNLGGCAHTERIFPWQTICGYLKLATDLIFDTAAVGQSNRLGKFRHRFNAQRLDSWLVKNNLAGIVQASPLNDYFHRGASLAHTGRDLFDMQKHCRVRGTAPHHGHAQQHEMKRNA